MKLRTFIFNVRNFKLHGCIDNFQMRTVKMKLRTGKYKVRILMIKVRPFNLNVRPFKQ